MSHDAPLPRYDELSAAEVETHARSLEAAVLEELLAYERAHGDRVQYIQVIEHRIAARREGQVPSGGDPATTGEGHAPAPPRDPAGPGTEGPPQNPPSHGVPTNTTQPRR